MGLFFLEIALVRTKKDSLWRLVSDLHTCKWLADMLLALIEWILSLISGL